MKIKSDSKVAIYGGSFNPIHIGHLITGLDVLKNLNYDYILYIPDNIPVHKDISNIIKGYHRFKMVKLAVKNIKNFLVSDIEIKRGDKSYTIDTVIALREILNYKNKFGIIIGDDLIDTLKNWKDIDELKNLADFIYLKRNHFENGNSIYNIKYADNRIINISSTEVRERIKNNLPIDYFVTPNVKKYILKNKLYKE